jgi:ATP-binding cassette subfamily B (MDR/TAP) protein 1
MLERFYDPDAGKVLIDGQDIKEINLVSMRQIIGYVGQEPVLFNTSIRENLKFAKADATEEEMIEALKAANAWTFIQENLGDKGIDTLVGASGGQLSGGQKQRIAIARAFLKKPKILLLDEATSALDKISEKAIQEAIDRYRQTVGNITTVVIAHRLSTIKDADKIVVIKDGALAEMGNHEELLENYPDGVYAGFVAKQKTAEEQQDNNGVEMQEVI